jgi:hypothetical protein|nr:MAG TPA: hypothetical protein [Crassvirales sp.]
MQLVIDSKFRPFSYDELVKPLTQYKEAYDKVEAQYSDLVSQTEQWKDIANRTKSPEAYAMYSKYANDLNNIVDDFSRGMTLQNRSQLMSMKRRYASEIQPIARASEAMKEANDLRVKSGPDSIFEVGEYNSLDQFLHGKTANNRSQSRDALTKRTAAMTEAAMASAMKDPEFKKALGDQYWMLTQHTGGSYADLKAAIANNPQAQNRFAEIKAQVMKEAGYDRYDAMGKQAIESAINTGLYAGLDKPVRSFQANQAYLNPLQAEQLSQAKTEFEWKKQARRPLPLGNGNYLDPVSGLTFTEDNKGKRTYNFSGKGSGKGSNKGSSGDGDNRSTRKVNRLAKPIKVKVGGGNPIEEYGDTVEPTGTKVPFNKLTGAARDIAKQYMNDDTSEGYDIYIETPGTWEWHSHQRMYIIPRKVESIDKEDEGENDI